jgi:signal transduction histidine kinase
MKNYKALINFLKLQFSYRTNTKILVSTLLSLFLFLNTSHSQTKNLNDLKIALTLKICQFVEWPTDTNTYFNIALYSHEEEFIKKFKKITENYRLKNKKINVFAINDIDSIKDNVQILYLQNQDLNSTVLWNKVNKHGVLLFTENFKDSKDFMFNLLPNYGKGSITFEFNRTNLIFEGFEIDNEIIELRGSEIDIREMYRQTKQRLDNEEKKVQNMGSKIDSQLISIDAQNKSIDNLKLYIKDLSFLIDSQTNNINRKEQILNELRKISAIQKLEINNNLSNITQQQQKINNANNSLKDQEQRISNQKGELEKLNQLIKTKQKEIAQKEEILTEKESLLNVKNKLIYLMVALFTLIVTIVFLIFSAYRTNNKAKKILGQQKKELENTLNKLTQTQTKLVQSEKMASLGILTSGIAHEINNPVNFINSGIQGMHKINQNILKILGAYREKYNQQDTNSEINELEKQLNLPFLLESSEKLINNIQTGVDRTVSIINSLRAFARSDEEEKKPVNLHENIDLALTILYNQYKYKIEIIKDYGDLPKIKCYPGKMNQVFMNILTNAIQAIPEKGTITISTSLVDNFVHISIKDTGLGIPANVRNKIFDPFFTTKEVGKGTGMGLSIVFSIISEHNGFIDVFTEIEKGTEFLIKLPAEL